VIEYTRWSRANALAIVLTTAVALWAELPALLGVVGAASFAWLLYRLRARWTPQGGFGLPNAITTLRLSLTSGLFFGGLMMPAWLLVLVATAVVTLDGLDGWVARRFGSQSDFGAHYDTAVDSLYTLALSVLLLAREVVGGWVMIAGLWHYAFVLWAWAFPSARESKRSLFAACIFVALVSTMGVAFLLPPAFATPLVGLAVILQSASFARSLWQQYGPA
jgi:phosphatidylglycerophosphate synthase